MGTSLRTVYGAFLARITADEWTIEEDLSVAEQDWQQLLNMAIFRFKYPRISLDYLPGENGRPAQYFQEELSNDEVQLLAIYMKHEWIKRCVANWENIKPLYADQDFSQANHLAQLVKAEKSIVEEVKQAEGVYDRSVNKRPSSIFHSLAGKKRGKSY